MTSLGSVAGAVGMALLLAIHCSCQKVDCAIASKPATPDEAMEELLTLEKHLKTHLELCGKPPGSWDVFLTFYANETRLDPTTPKIAKGDWTYEATGETIVLRNRTHPQVQAVKWLSLEEQMKIAEEASGAQLQRIVDIWRRDYRKGGCEGEFYRTIAPVLKRAIASENQETRGECLRCMSRLLARTNWKKATKDDPNVRETIALVRSLLFHADSRSTASDMLAYLPSDLWNEIAQEMANDPDPAVRTIVPLLLNSRNFREFGLPGRLFRKLYQDPDRRVYLEVICLMGTRVGKFLTPSTEFFDDPPLETYIKILSGDDREAKAALVRSLGPLGLGYLNGEIRRSDESSKKEKSEWFVSLLSELGSDPDLVRRVCAQLGVSHSRSHIGGFRWPTTFEQVKPFVESRHPIDLKIAGEALLMLARRLRAKGAKSEVELADANRAKGAFAHLAYSLEGNDLLLFLKWIPRHSRIGRAFSSSETLLMYGKWMADASSQVRLKTVGYLRDLLRIQRWPNYLRASLKGQGALSEQDKNEIARMKKILLADADDEVRLAATKAFLSEDDKALRAWFNVQLEPIKSAAVLEFGTVQRPWLKPELERVLRLGDTACRWEAHNRLLEIGGSPTAERYTEGLWPEYLVRRSRADLRALHRAVDSYFTDDARGPYVVSRLTTPVSYIKAIPHDPFRSDGDTRYRYIRPNPERNLFYLLQGVGPDGKDDLAPLLDELPGPLSRSNEDRRPLENLLRPICYDPTNGILSSGDLIRGRPF